MIVCFGLVSLALMFGHSMIMAYRGCDNALAGCQADQAVEAGARYAMNVIASGTAQGVMPDPTLYQSEALSIGDATFWFIGIPEPTDSGTTPVFGLVDEASKINLNAASRDMLSNLPGMTDDLVAAVMQWRSAADSDITSGFSISSTPSKGGRFESVPELAILTGSDASLLYGRDLNLNHVLDPYEADLPQPSGTLSSGISVSSDGSVNAGLFEYLTVFTLEPAQVSGSARFDVTKRPAPNELRTFLSANLDRTKADALWNATQTGPPVKSVLELCNRVNLTDDEYAKIGPSLRGSRLRGLVNVNTAGKTVLACIPGITTDLAAQIVAARSQRTQPSTGLVWVAPLLGPAVPQAGEWLTDRTYQISADVAAVGRHGRGYRRTQFILDSASGTPRIVYRRNLAPLGWALGSAARDTLALKREIQ